MRNLTFRIGTGVLTFFVGVSLATAWVFHLGSTIQPIRLPQCENPTGIEGNIGEMPTLEMVFVLDTTASMAGLIDGAKQRIWGIVNEVMQTSSHPSVRIGLIGYRDRGDEYVTTVLPLTNDLDKVYSTLMDYRAAGGGDTPENVRHALADGVRHAGWSKASSDVARIIFLVGDAPPHNDYQDEPDTATTTTEAVQKGMIVNTIQCGEIPGTREIWQAIARLGQGQYFSIAQDGGVEAINTPYDEQLGELARRLGATYLAYGGGAGTAGERKRAEVSEEKAQIEARVATDAAAPARAERALNKALNSEAYVGDLLQNIENGSLNLETVKDEDLPADLRKLSLQERKQEIERRLAERRSLRTQIVALSKERDQFIGSERKKLSGGRQSGFDSAVAAALKEQLGRKGIK